MTDDSGHTMNKAPDRPRESMCVYAPMDATECKSATADRHTGIQQRACFPVRLRLILAFATIFVYCAGVTLWTIYVLPAVHHKIRFLELADAYRHETAQMRRFEKNYFLYGTHLQDALLHTQKARSILADNEADILKVMSRGRLSAMQKSLASYAAGLQKLAGGHSPEVRAAVQHRLRKYGHRLTADADAFSIQERRALDRTFSLLRTGPLILLAVLMVILFAAAWHINRKIVTALGRLTDFTERIAAGDYTRITLKKTCRDEFTQLATAMNQMIDEIEKRQEILVQSHKIRAIGNLVAGVAHELNNPLNNILLTAVSLQESYADLPPAKALEMLADVVGETERSREIVRNLLDFARQREREIKRLDLGEMLGRAIRLVSSQARMSKIRIETCIPDNLPPVHSDRQLLIQLFVNLLLNAVDALSQNAHGRIAVTVDAPTQAEYVAVSITDNGPGIPRRLQDRIFDPFFTTKPEGRGTGLGLSVSRNIIEQLGGFMRVASEVGKGATFTVYLPVTRVPH